MRKTSTLNNNIKLKEILRKYSASTWRRSTVTAMLYRSSRENVLCDVTTVWDPPSDRIVPSVCDAETRNHKHAEMPVCAGGRDQSSISALVATRRRRRTNSRSKLYAALSSSAAKRRNYVVSCTNCTTWFWIEKKLMARTAINGTHSY